MGYVLDRDGRRVHPGDYVACATKQYDSIQSGEVRRVQRIENECIVLRNGFSPYRTSPYRPCNFTLVEGQRHIIKGYSNWINKEPKMLHIALRINDQTFEEMALAIQSSRPGMVAGDQLMADTSASAIKERIKARLATHPDEKWLILSGNTIGERSDPPVRFRSV